MTGKISAGDELWDEMIAHDQQLGKQVYIDGGNLIINVEYEYPIELSRLDTHAKILAWIVHLADKTWMTPDVLQRFVYLAAQRHGLELTQP